MGTMCAWSRLAAASASARKRSMSRGVASSPLRIIFRATSRFTGRGGGVGGAVGVGGQAQVGGLAVEAVAVGEEGTQPPGQARALVLRRTSPLSIVSGQRRPAFSKELHLLTLPALGWNDDWSAHFAPHARAGLVPG